MDISKVSAPGAIREGRTGPAQKPDQGPEATGQELIPVAPNPRESSLRQSLRPSPAFLAHLIATAQHAPQTRARGRAAPADAIARYTNGISVGIPARKTGWTA
jgi:hypothetical protein